MASEHQLPDHDPAPGGRRKSFWARWREGGRAARARRERTFALYHAVVRQARLEVFYAEMDVPDTTEGRLEMIGLHAILVMHRLRDGGEAAQRLSQELFDLLFVDLDRALREQGVGDLSVGKHVKAGAQTFLARLKAIGAALDAGDEEASAAALGRNVFGDGAAARGDSARRLAAYLHRQNEVLAARPLDLLLEGDPGFAPPG